VPLKFGMEAIGEWFLTANARHRIRAATTGKDTEI
jgi:hypothetical protein